MGLPIADNPQTWNIQMIYISYMYVYVYEGMGGTALPHRRLAQGNKTYLCS